MNRDLRDRLDAARRRGTGTRLTPEDVEVLLAVLDARPDYVRDDFDALSPADVDLDDPVERAAIITQLWTWNVPEACVPMLTRDEGLVRERWATADARLVRDLSRRRVVALLDAFAGRL